MELLLNLLWLTASVSLGIVLIYSRGGRGVTSKDCIHSQPAAWFSYLILIAMLLPAISMTDDMQAMVTPSDGEQIVRRFEAAVPSHPPVHLHTTTFLQVGSVWLAPILEVRSLGADRDSNPSYIWHRQTMFGRAPPIAG